MDTSKITSILMARHGEVSDSDKANLKKLVENTTEDEQAGVVTTLRRGGSMRDAMDWLKDARSASQDLDDASYELALSMYGDSTLLAWKECLSIAPALTYRSPLLDEVDIAAAERSHSTPGSAEHAPSAT